jgi:DEAD/DEAH box helicase
MDRALDPELIAGALGQHSALPTSEELSELLERAELSLVRGLEAIDARLLNSGWYLHGVASSPAAADVYPAARRRQAFQVSAHIFDLATRSRHLSSLERSKLTFAGQVGYHESGLDPNAIALYRRTGLGAREPVALVSSDATPAVLAGASLLGMDRRVAFPLLNDLHAQADRLSNSLNITSIARTSFGAAVGAIRGARSLLTYLTYGRQSDLDRARATLAQAIQSPESAGDIDSRWVAAHLLRISDGFEAASVWTVLPPIVDAGSIRAFAMGDPPVLTLWPPQLRLLSSIEPNPLLPDVKRVFLSLPTTAGKSLIAQAFVLTHLAAVGTGVCYVAPTRSLCREVRRNLRSRLRLVNREVVVETGMAGPVRVTLPADVEVMTPERLAYLLRTAPEETLSRFGMFVIDEAHTVGDPTRGWTLEGVISFLHLATRDSPHKLVLLSSSIGNRAHFAAWLDPQGTGVALHEDWRGPRRLTGVYTSEPITSERVVRRTRSNDFPERELMPLRGVLRVRSGAGRRIQQLSLRDPVGTLALDHPARGSRRRRNATDTTAFYRQLVPLIRALGRAGPVLVICATRQSTRRLADALAETLGSAGTDAQQLSDLVAERIGARHPIVPILRRGVAPHYAALPDDVLVAIEEAIRSSAVRYIVATTTLTEGVNLPVHTVVIAEQGAFGSEGYEEYITGSRLINAIGRAGRAGRECEGWVVLGRQARFAPADFDRVEISADDVEIESTLAVPRALAELVRFEDEHRGNADAVLVSGGTAVDDFAAFLWFLADAFDQLGREGFALTPEGALEATLAWHQLDDEARRRWIELGSQALDAYSRTAEGSRQRWARAGTSIGSAREIERVAMSTATSCLGRTDIIDPLVTLDVLASEAFPTLLSLPEAPDLRMWAARAGRRRVPVAIDLAPLLAAWISGEDLGQIADQFLGEVEDEEYRLEQLTDFVTSLVGHYLAWTSGIVIQWANELLVGRDAEHVQLSVALPAFLREGVGSPAALEFLRRGVRSRRLAHSVATAFERETAADQQADLRDWLVGIGIAGWRARFSPTALDYADLLDFTRSPTGGVLGQLLDGRDAVVACERVSGEVAPGPVEVQPVHDDEPPQRLGLLQDGRLVGVVPLSHQADIGTLREMGLPIVTTCDVDASRLVLTIAPARDESAE